MFKEVNYTMKIELKFMNNNINKQDIINDMIKVSQKLNRNDLIFKDYKNNGGIYSDGPISRLFGTWNIALIESGLSLSHVNYYSDEELFENLENLWIRLGKQPSRRDCTKENGSKMTYQPYVRRFGSWTNALLQFANHINFELPNQNTKLNFDKKHKTGRDINIRLRYKVMKRDNFKCSICGRSPSTTPNLELHVDHIKPYSKGGETILENLQTLCNDCNLGKSNLE